MQTELEWQFDAMDVRPVERWLAAWAIEGGGVVRARGGTRLVDTYLDTEDWRLHRAGYALRVRTRRGRTEATLKALTEDAGGLRSRTEITEEVEGSALDGLASSDGPVGRRLRDVSGSRSLRILCEVRTTRRTFDVSVGIDGGARTADAEVALDETAIPTAERGRPARLRRVEVEVREGPASDVAPFVERLASATGLRPAALSKFEAGLLALGLTPWTPPDLGPTDIDATNTTGEVAFAALRQHLTSFIEHEPGARMGDGPEDVHDMRVATRRMRAVLALFEEALPARAQRYRDELKWVADALGAARDLDVQLEWLRGWLADPLDAEGARAVIALVEEAHAGARRDLLAVLDSNRYARLVDGFASMVRRGPLRAQALAWQPIVSVAPDLVASRRRAVRKAVRKLGRDGAEDKALHRVRIRCKRLRYCLEAVTPVYPDRVGEVLEGLVRIQDLLGARQDAVVGTERVRSLVERRGGELGIGPAFVLGRMAERYGQDAIRAGRRFSKADPRMKGRAWKRLRRAMAKQEADAAPPAPVPRLVVASTSPEAAPTESASTAQAPEGR